MRDNDHLKTKLSYIWDQYFQDVKKSNQVIIRFGPKARKRLGSIRRCNKSNCDLSQFDTLILMNGHFKDEQIPESVIDATIAHELCHYAQGVSSPLPRLSRYAHRGGLVDKDLEQRGLKALVDFEDQWLHKNWLKYLRKING